MALIRFYFKVQPEQIRDIDHFAELWTEIEWLLKIGALTIKLDK